MRMVRHLGAILALLSASVTTSQSARADELLVMPYSCQVLGGRIRLRPSEDHGHPVIGRREQQEFRACSPADPRQCRRWTVYRFDLDCGGVRVPWVEVAAAAGAGGEDGEAFVADGRFELEMPPRWSLPPDAPCARGGDIEGPGFRRFCAERLARVPRVTVAMPRGFAPMSGLDAIFVNEQTPRGAMAEAPPAPRDELIPAPVANPHRGNAVARPEPAAKTPPKEQPAPHAPAHVAEAPAPKVPPSSEPAKSKDDAPAGPAVAEARPIIPQIINGANAPASAPRTDGSVSETGALPDQPSSASDEKATVQSEVAGSDATVPDRIASAEREDAVSSLSAALSNAPFAGNMTVITAGTLALLTLLTLAIVLRRGRAQTVPALSRDISAVSLDLHASRDGRDTKSALAIVPEPLTGRNLDPIPSLSSGPPTPAPLGDAMPRTRAEALEVLGMGIAPEVNEAAIKKIIDGLRLSWHPDHARDPADRAMRELRLKQINAAWDIIAGKRVS